jgi:hypothetical protein
MIKHKITGSHEDLAPWEMHPPGSGKVERFPEDFDPKENKAHTNAYIFVWEVYWGLKGNEKYSLKQNLNRWWDNCFTKDFPEEGGTVSSIVDLIYNKLVDLGHEEVGIDPTESDYDLPSIITAQQEWSTVKGETVKKQSYEEETMGKIILKKKVPASVVDKKAAGKKPVAQEAGDESDTGKTKRTRSDGIPKWVTSSRPGTKAHESKLLICKLLMERKHTDEEICMMVEAELEYGVSVPRVNFYRDTLNKGRFEPLGFKQPEPLVENIVNKSAVVKSSPAKKVAATPQARAEETAALSKAKTPVKKLLLKKSK